MLFSKRPTRLLAAALLVLYTITTTPAALAIDSPSNIRGVETAQSTVDWSWEAVPGAVAYAARVDGIEVGIVQTTTLQSTDMWAGEHSLTVRAIDADSNYSIQSNTAIVEVDDVFDASTSNQSYLAGASRMSAGRAPAATSNRQFNATDDEADPEPTPEPTPEPIEDNGLIDPRSWDMPEVLEKDGYELVFSDEFNSDYLNPARWNGQLRWDGEWNGERFEYRVINGEDQFYVNPLSEDQEHLDTILTQYNPFQFDGQRLAIRATLNPLKDSDSERSHGPLSRIAPQQTFLSGAISTYDKFVEKYGYFEANIKIPSADGTFPAFWLHHQKRSYEGTQRTEIDIMENLGHAPHYIYNSFHYNTDVARGRYGTPHFIRPQPDGQIFTGTDYSLDYHVYAVEWSPGYVAWFIDGQKVSEMYNSNVDHEELYLIINMAMGGNWTNFPENSGGMGRADDNHFPNDEDVANFADPALEIDYVRVYKRR